jgi:hypothetical protein
MSKRQSGVLNIGLGKTEPEPEPQVTDGLPEVEVTEADTENRPFSIKANSTGERLEWRQAAAANRMTPHAFFRWAVRELVARTKEGYRVPAGAQSKKK